MEPILELEQRLARYDAARYPVQHATTRFHLGVVLADAGRVEEAIESLASAAELFDPDALPVEHAKALNALGAALRLAGELDSAEASFERATELFERSSLKQEHGAALFNLGLVRRERDPAAAAECFRRAASILAGGLEAAAARELGATLLALGELEEATPMLERAVALAERGDAAGYGGALNGLGLARLAAGETEAAIESFRQAAGAHPRGVRPAEFAMAKANLALAYEQHGYTPRARLAARQALGVAEPPVPVSAQAMAVLERLGSATAEDLRRVLDDEPQESWEGIVREELARSGEAPAEVRRADAVAWIDGSSVERAEAWLGGLLELPPERMETLIRSALEALGPRDAAVKGRFRSDVTRAAARFHVPQLLRLEEIFRRTAAELGEPWS
ncbi:MAG: tetratricopeptide repeat protein [Actinobacteria bacterium]|nr:tetratricopeptide repeat protein [Actinomycetota bacterium]